MARTKRQCVVKKEALKIIEKQNQTQDMKKNYKKKVTRKKVVTNDVNNNKVALKKVITTKVATKKVTITIPNKEIPIKTDYARQRLLEKKYRESFIESAMGSKKFNSLVEVDGSAPVARKRLTKKDRLHLARLAFHNRPKDLFWRLFPSLLHPLTNSDVTEEIQIVSNRLTNLDHVLLIHHLLPLSCFSTIVCQESLHFRMNSEISLSAWKSFFAHNSDITHLMVYWCFSHVNDLVLQLIAQELKSLTHLTLHMMQGCFAGLGLIKDICEKLKNLKMLTVSYYSRPYTGRKRLMEHFGVKLIMISLKWSPNIPSIGQPHPMGIMCKVGNDNEELQDVEDLVEGFNC